MKYLFVSLSFLCFSILDAQNLIPNPGFEQCDACDANGFKELGIGLGANNPIDWNAATFGTPDFRSTYPHSGKKHGGFFTGFQKHEYLVNHFSTTLMAGATYQFSFWIQGSTQNLNYAIDEIGVYLLKGEAIYPQAEPLKQLTPTFKSKEGEFIDAKNYIRLSFEYKACGGEDHFIVGRFAPLGQGDTSFVGKKRPVNPGSEAIYYFVDDFEMIETNPAPSYDLLPSEITLCPDSSKTLSIPDPLRTMKIIWSNGETLPEIQIKNEGKIWVQVQLDDACNTILRDTVIISYFPNVNLKILSTDSICNGDTIELRALCNGDCFEFRWSNGMNTDVSKISEAGIYTVTAKSACKEISKSKEIFSLNRKINRFIEFPNVISLNGQVGNESFQPYIKPEEIQRIKKLKWVIFNRWGKKVFETNKVNDKWTPGSDNPNDTYLYYYEVEYLDCNGLTTDVFKGNFSLLK